MSRTEAFKSGQFGPHNNDPALTSIMQGREVSHEDIPVDRIMGGTKLNAAKVNRYARLATPMPSVVAVPAPEGQFMVLDGNHRAAAAKKRGDSHISAYVGRKVSSVEK